MAEIKEKSEVPPKALINKNTPQEKHIEKSASFKEYLTMLINKNKANIKEITIRGKHVEKKGWRLSVNLVEK